MNILRVIVQTAYGLLIVSATAVALGLAGFAIWTAGQTTGWATVWCASAGLFWLGVGLDMCYALGGDSLAMKSGAREATKEAEHADPQV